MDNFNVREFLNFEGLSTYDELIKKYIKEITDNGGSALETESERAQAAEKAIIESLSTLAENHKAAIDDNAKAIEILNGDEETEGSVSKSIKDAIDALVNGAPEALDTLKEIADWIGNDETGTASLINRVAENEKAIEDLKEYSDAKDIEVYNSIQNIESLKIQALFPNAQGEATVSEAINTMNEGSALKLNADQEIAEDITISKSCYIDANGSTFSGMVTVPANADVVIVNATFANPVVMA